MIIKKLIKIWHMTGISIYEGKRYEDSLSNMTFVSAVLAVPAVMGIIFNFRHLWKASLSFCFYLIIDFSIFYFSAIKKNRNAAVKACVVLTILASTNIALFAKNGFSAYWPLSFSLMISYLCSVRAGIFCSA